MTISLMFEIFFIFFSVLSFAILVWQWVAGMNIPLHQRDKQIKLSNYPSVTLFKPLKGCDSQTIKCITSWITQDYPGSLQILFGVADPNDPVISPLKKLLKSFPHTNTQIVICSGNKGLNKKVSTLIQLSTLATGKIWIMSDADVFAPSDLLLNLVVPLDNPANGAVNCFYRMVGAQSFAMSFESIAVNADFWSQVAQSLCLSEQNFCLGAVIALKADFFKTIGGYEPLADMLADDYHIGNRMYKSGKRIILSHVVVDCVASPMSFRAIWAHQLRWARTIRFERPVSYALSILSNCSFWALLWACVGFSSYRFLWLAFVILFRTITTFNLEKKILKGTKTKTYAWMAVPKDIFAFVQWISAFLSQHVVWQGNVLKVKRGKVLQVKK